MYDIEDTEATLDNTAYTTSASITKLCGEVGNPYLKLYNDFVPGYFGLGFSISIGITAPVFLLNAVSSFQAYKLSKGDGIEFHFIDGSFFTVKLSIGKIAMNGYNLSIAGITTQQAIKLSQVYLGKVRVISAKSNQFIDCHFKPGPGNLQYDRPERGQQAVHIMLRRLIGCLQDDSPVMPDSKGIKQRTFLEVPDIADRFGDLEREHKPT